MKRVASHSSNAKRQWHLTFVSILYVGYHATRQKRTFISWRHLSVHQDGAVKGPDRNRRMHKYQCMS